MKARRSRQREDKKPREDKDSVKTKREKIKIRQNIANTQMKEDGHEYKTKLSGRRKSREQGRGQTAQRTNERNIERSINTIIWEMNERY